MSRLPEGSTLVEAHDLTRRFASTVAVEDLDLRVESGTIVGLIGPSGSGKTTAVRMLCGLDRPSEGAVSLFGQPAHALSRRDRRRISLLSQDPALVPEFSIREHVTFAARLAGVRRRARRDAVDAVLASVDLLEAADTAVADASGGMKRRAGLAGAIVSDPDLVFCDEPSAGLDPILRDSIWRWFRERRRRGATMIVTTQHIDEAARCDRVIVLRDGSVIADAVPADLAEGAGLAERLVVELHPEDTAGLVTVRNTLIAAGYDVTTADHSVIVTAEDAAAAAPAVTELILAEGVEPRAIDTSVPGLDEVFRALVEAT